MIPVSKTEMTFDMPQPPRNTMVKKPLEIFSTFPITEEESIYHYRGMSGTFPLNFNERYHRHTNNVVFIGYLCVNLSGPTIFLWKRRLCSKSLNI